MCRGLSWLARQLTINIHRHTHTTGEEDGYEGMGIEYKISNVNLHTTQNIHTYDTITQYDELELDKTTATLRHASSVIRPALRLYYARIKPQKK